jgi:hypothetical protein
MSEFKKILQKKLKMNIMEMRGGCEGVCEGDGLDEI